MGTFSWFGGFLGWVIWGPIGALLGYVAGAAVDGFVEGIQITEAGDRSKDRRWQGGTQHRRSYTPQEQQNSFIVSLLVLASAVIKADGKILSQEKDMVREFIRSNFGEQAVPEAMRILEKINSQEVNIYTVGDQIAANMNYSQRLQLFHFLTRIALADNDFHKSEKYVLEAIGSTIGLAESDISSIISMFYKENSSAYSVLGISPSASDDEVRTAYRRMAMKNHPDKVATLGPEVQKAAAEKFRQIQDAYESIKQDRGMV